MLFRTRLPSPSLARFVELLWFYSGEGPAHRLERVLPDGAAELVINLDDVPRKRFDRRNSRRFETVRRSWISGPQPEFILIDVLPRATMMGAHFKPGGLAPFLGMPASEMTGELVELDRLWGGAADALRDALLEAPEIAVKFELLEGFLARRLQPAASLSPVVGAALRCFAGDPIVPTIGSVAHRLGMSHKHLVNRFQAEVGLSPKRFCRIQRFQRTLAELRTRRAVDWADVAAAGGYYDQAHLIKDFRAFSGLTPAQYLGQPGADNRFVPVQDGAVD